jgi:hypothetical protein
MYTFAYSKACLTLVGLLTGESSTDDDYERLYQSVSAIEADWLADPGKTTITVLVTDPSHARPNATWRARFAELRKRSRIKKRAFALVTSSLLLRGAYKAINWLAPPSHPQDVFATFEEAAQWVEGVLGQPHPILRRLFYEARAEAGLT